MPVRARPLLTALAAVAAAVPAVALADGTPAVSRRPATVANGTPVRATGTDDTATRTSGTATGSVAVATTTGTHTTPVAPGPPRHGTPLRPVSGLPCPSVAPRTVRVSATPGANRTLVPGRPASVVLCRYNGLPEGAGSHLPGAGDAGFTLLGEGALTGAGARALASQFNALGALPPGVETFACPADFATVATATFAYADGIPADPVTVELSGCRDSQNGHLLRVGYPAALTRLTAGSVRFVRAHEATVRGRLRGDLAGLSVEVEDASGDITSLAHRVVRGRFRLLVTVGEDTLLLIRNGEAGHPVTVLRRRLRLAPGRTLSLALSLPRR